MPVGKNEGAADAAETVNLSTVPGFHVVRKDGQFLGTYNTEVDAQCFIDQQVVPNGESASIVTGPALPAE